MKIREMHGWNLTPSEAIALQKELALQISRSYRIPEPLRLAHIAASGK